MGTRDFLSTGRDGRTLGSIVAILALLFMVVILFPRDPTIENRIDGAVQAIIAAQPGPAVRFVPTELPLFSGQEMQAAWQSQVRGSLAKWRLYLVRGDGEPELLAETGRQISRLQWTDGNTISTTFESLSPDNYPPPSQRADRPLTGFMRFTVSTSSLASLSTDFATRS
jgi:hypothetical protein